MKNKKRILIGAALGALVGFAYWRWIGCNTGNCMITSHPVISTIYGGIMGGLLFSSFEKKTKPTT